MLRLTHGAGNQLSVRKLQASSLPESAVEVADVFSFSLTSLTISSEYNDFDILKLSATCQSPRERAEPYVARFAGCGTHSSHFHCHPPEDRTSHSANTRAHTGFAELDFLRCHI